MKINYDKLASNFQKTVNTKGADYFYQGIFSNSYVTLKGDRFKDFFIVTEDDNCFVNKISLPFYSFEWNKNITTTLVPLEKIERFKYLFANNNLSINNALYDELEKRGLSLFDYTEGKESYHTGSSSDGYRRGANITKKLSPFEVMCLENKDTVKEVKALVAKEQQEFKDKFFKTVEILDLTEYDIEFIEDSSYDNFTDEEVKEILERINE